jgi:uncharacterized SAM-binding protein YcdF (DUF218 family)
MREADTVALSPVNRVLRSALRRAQQLLALLGLFVVLVTFTPLDNWWATLLAGPWNDPHGDILIVLGGSVIDGGTIGVSTYWRSVYAVLTWKEGGFREIVVSGGGVEGQSVAKGMRDFLVSQGVPPEKIQLETKSRSTRENALFVKDLLANTPGSKVLLTSDYHMFRASRAFRKVGLDVLPRPFPDARKSGTSYLNRWGTFLTLAQETVKIGYYRIRGWI